MNDVALKNEASGEYNFSIVNNDLVELNNKKMFFRRG